MIYIGIHSHPLGHYAMTPTTGPRAFVDPAALLKWAMELGDEWLFGLDTSAGGERLARWLHGRGYAVRWLPVAEGNGPERARSMAKALQGGAGLPFEALTAARMLAMADQLRRKGAEMMARADRMGMVAWGLAGA